jgi:hypothetical protein
MSRNLEVLSYEKRLDNLFQQTKSLSDDPFIQSHWARYLCVLSAGYLETSVRLIYSEYARKRSSSQVANYVDAQLRNFQSAKMNNILQLAGMFNPEWKDRLATETNGELSDSVNSIISNRHQIAHGKDTGVSLANLKIWYKNATKVIELLESLCV